MSWRLTETLRQPENTPHLDCLPPGDEKKFGPLGSLSSGKPQSPRIGDTVRVVEGRLGPSSVLVHVDWTETDITPLYLGRLSQLGLCL